MTSNLKAVIPIQPNVARGQATKLTAHNGKIVYTNGRTVVIRDLEAPSLAKTYSQHVKNATIARFSPSGYYCASGDESGLVKIWDTVGEEQILKAEYRVIAGRINDIAWDSESKRLIAVGNCPSKYGSAFMLDTGASTGEITGHEKAINSVAIRQQRPFRAATAGDDNRIVFFHGAPYKKDRIIETHSSIVQDVRYAPSGDNFVSVGWDKKIFIYDGKTGDTLGEFIDGGHTGSIMACSWSPDNRNLVTSSMDRTVKLWDVENKKSIQTWTLGSDVQHQQVGNVWSGTSDIVSLSLSSDLNVFDPRTPDKPSRVLQGATKPIMKLAASKDETFVAGCGDGRVLSYDSSSYAAQAIPGKGHSSLITGFATGPTKSVFSIGYDDHVREIDSSAYSPLAQKTTQQPKSIAVGEDGTVFVAEIETIEILDTAGQITSFKPSSSAKLGYLPSCISSAKSLVAVGSEDKKVRLYEWSKGGLKTSTQRPEVLEGSKDSITSIAFSPDASHLAVADVKGKIVVFDVNSGTIVTNKWYHHSARVDSLSWTADGLHCASASLDTSAYVWSLDKPLKSIPLKNIGPGGLNAVHWVESGSGSGTLVTSGSDGCLRFWGISFHS